MSRASPWYASVAGLPSGCFAAHASTRSSAARCFSTILPRRRPAIWPSAFLRVFSSPRRSSIVAIAASGERAASSSRIPIHSASMSRIAGNQRSSRSFISSAIHERYERPG